MHSEAEMLADVGVAITVDHLFQSDPPEAEIFESGSYCVNSVAL